ncbi:MAG: AIR synthase-related protein, partial [Candidatus Neomarinimicrobiota bacterium]
PIFKVMQDIGNIDEREMSRTFNMGIGMVLIVPADQKQKIFSILDRKIAVYEIGEIIHGKPSLSFV